jgi:phosphatidylglycerol---prolipoprotein diacylglyceryl transferase
MFPILLKLGPLTIKTYGLFVALGFIASLQYTLWRSKSKGFIDEQIMDIVLYIVIAGLIGGRLMYVLLNWQFYFKNPLSIFQIWEGGLVFYGGLIASLLVFWFYVYQNSYFKYWEFLDIFAPAIALGHFLGRLGCFFAGCCYGLPTTLPWGIKFTDSQCLAPQNIYLHPIQIYEALLNILLFFALDWFNKFKHPKGQTFAAYLFFYGIIRFHLEFFRGDDRGGFLLGLSVSQYISILLIAGSVGLILWINKNGKNNSTN